MASNNTSNWTTGGTITTNGGTSFNITSSHIRVDDHDQVCLVMGHRFSQSSEIRYADGLVVGCCERCGTRLEIPHQLGDMIQRLKELIAQVLVNTDEIPEDFFALVEALVEKREAIEDVLDTAELVKHLVARELK